MTGAKLGDLGFREEIQPHYYAIKEAVFPFARFPGCDIILSPEMKSTGEVMGIDTSQGISYFKSQLGAGNRIPESGNIFLSVKDADKKELIPFADPVGTRIRRLRDSIPTWL